MPLRYGIPQFEPCIQLKLHRMLVDKYSVFYLVDGGTVTVTDVIYSSADLESWLGQRHDSVRWRWNGSAENDMNDAKRELAQRASSSVILHFDDPLVLLLRQLARLGSVSPFHRLP